jgi:hypothetical protein
MKCPRCGHENARGANYCSSCGAVLGDEDETTLSLAALEDRQALEEELGDRLTDLPDGMGMLVVRRGPGSGSTYVLEADVTTLGRHPNSDIFLDDVTVSRRHAVIERAAAGYQIADVGSLNGTYVHHERIEKSPLSDLDEVQIGRFVLTFVLGHMEPPT